MFWYVWRIYALVAGEYLIAFVSDWGSIGMGGM